nr:DUF11 domain-containing protein [Lautropia sp.]
MLSAARLSVPDRKRLPVPSLLLQRLQPLALEPRLLFDGAGLATADAAMAASAERPAAGGADGVAAASGGRVVASGDTGVAGREPLLLIAASAQGGEPVAISLHKGAFADGEALQAAVLAGGEAVGEADLAGVDAADTVHYAISVSNRGTGYAYDLQVQDQLPGQIDISGVSQLRLLGADGAEVDYSAGNVLRNAASGESIRSESDFAAALFSDCAVEFIDPGCGEGYLGGSFTGGRPSEVTIAYEVKLPGTVVAGSAISNQADLVQVAAQECGANLADACPQPGDGATVTLDGASLTTRLTGTSQAHTTGADAVIGEILCYETVITVPEGSSPEAVLTQRLDPGLSLVSVDSIVYSDGVQAQSQPDPAAIVPEDVGGEANRFVIDFGDISNRNRDNHVADTITVTFRAVTGNVLANQQGQELVVEAGYRSGDGSKAGAALVELAAAAVPVTVVEPVLSVTVVPDGERVEAGGQAEFIITISNDSGVDAFDVTVDDIVLPPGLQLHPRSWEPGQEAGLVAAVLPAGERASHRLVTVVARDATVGQELSVDVQVRYTSVGDGAADCSGCAQAGDNQDLSPFVEGSDRERTGEDGPGGLNDYVAGDAGSVLPVAVPPPACPPPPPS